MTRVVYVNGRYRPYAEAAVHVEDRGFQLGDAVYEVCQVRQGHIIDEARHLARLWRSLGELSIPTPMGDRALGHVIRETIRRNRVRNGMVYVQVSRGVARRDFAFPANDTPPTLVCFARSIPLARQQAQAETGIKVITQPDLRWRRCDIKTVMLLPACLARQAASEAGAKEAWLIDAEGYVTEGAASNAWIVEADGVLVTRQIDRAILAGVTRATLLDAIARAGLQVAERRFTPQEACRAAEAFVTAATNTVMPVVAIDGTAIGDGRPGPVVRQLRKIFQEVAAATT